MKCYRIYINQNCLLIADAIPQQIFKTQQLDLASFDFFNFYTSLVKGSKKDYIIVTKEPKRLFNAIKKKLIVIKAAGGLVKNSTGDFLFIFRNKKWDLPKGKVEKGERIKITAVREVEEECGVKIAKRNKRLCKTYHVYEMDDKIILKRTSWFAMDVKGMPKLIPQVDEGITAANWVNPLAIVEKAKNTYPAIIDVLKKGNLL